MRWLAVLAALVVGACGESPPEPAQPPALDATVDFYRSGDWPSYNRDLGGTRFSPLTAITPSNVDELRQAWSYPLGAAAGGSALTPVVVRGVLYATAAERVVAVRADSGAEVWRHVVAPEAPSHRGVTFWAGDQRAASRVFVTAGQRLIALDAGTGLPASTFGVAGEIDMGVPYAAVPTLFEDLLIVGSNGLPGGVQAFDVITGAKRWSFEGDADESTNGVDPSPPPLAFSFTIDVDRALLYAVLGRPAADRFYGGNRVGADPYGNAVAALDARSGEVRWRVQLVHHDVWGFDLAAPPTLLDVAIGGQRVPILALAGSTGYLYVLNRATGEAVFGLVETPMPSSDVPGERLSATQPIPVKPPPVARVSFLADDLVTAADTNAAHAAFCRELRDRSGGLQNVGPFTPYRHRAPGAEPRSTVVFPGSLGGAGWGGVAADPNLGLLFVNVSNEGGIGWIEANVADATSAQTSVGARRARLPYRQNSALGGPFARFSATMSGLAWPCQKPPWGQLVAVDATTGDVVWQVPLGITEELPGARAHTGRLNSGGPISTASGLVFIGATDDRRFRAFDSRTGAELWVTELPISAHAVPVTYRADDGKQYVAVVAAGAASTDDGAASGAQSLIAYSLP